jgi:hypothetical protein
MSQCGERRLGCDCTAVIGFLGWMIRLWPSLIDTVQVVQPETVLRWHRAGFRALEIEEKGRAAED